MQFNFDIDVKSFQEEAVKKLQEKMRAAVMTEVDNFFGQTSYYREGKIVRVNAPGRQEIVEIMEKKFIDDNFKKNAEKFFEDNWKRIFEECMTKAIQHKANAIAFAKTKELKT